MKETWWSSIMSAGVQMDILFTGNVFFFYSATNYANLLMALWPLLLLYFQSFRLVLLSYSQHRRSIQWRKHTSNPTFERKPGNLFFYISFSRKLSGRKSF